MLTPSKPRNGAPERVINQLVGGYQHGMLTVLNGTVPPLEWLFTMATTGSQATLDKELHAYHNRVLETTHCSLQVDGLVHLPIQTNKGHLHHQDIRGAQQDKCETARWLGISCLATAWGKEEQCLFMGVCALWQPLAHGLATHQVTAGCGPQ